MTEEAPRKKFDAAYYREYRKKNRDILLLRKRLYYYDHREECLERVRRCVANDPNIKEKRHQYYIKRRNEARSKQTEKDRVQS